MILCDLNQIIYPAILANFAREQIELSLIRHIVFNSIRRNNSKFRDKYGQFILCDDSRNYWRKQYFPYYKSHRQGHRDSSGLDWTTIFSYVGEVKKELQELLVYKYICVDEAEADDVIAVLTQQRTEPVLILSGDKDFAQLHDLDVEQYDPVRLKFVKVKNSQEKLLEHIIRGDRGDGIPNVRSNDNCFAIGERQKTISALTYKNLCAHVKDPTSPNYRNYIRNKTLIDLSMIPDYIQSNIIEQFGRLEIENDRAELLNYFIHNRMSQQIEHIAEF